MHPDTPQFPDEKQPTRVRSSSFANRFGLALPRSVETADLMQALSIIVSAAVIWLALYYTR